MSDAFASDRDWPSSPRFTTVPRGYWGFEVDRLLDELKTAHGAGEPLSPILAARELSEVGFGYDMAEVDAFLGRLQDGTGTEPASATASPSVEPVPAQAPTPHVAMEDNSPRIPADASRMLSEIKQMRFPLAHSLSSGYDAGDVDAFLYQLADCIQAGGSVLRDLSAVRFLMTRRGGSGYDVDAVDDFMDRVEKFGRDDDAARESAGDRPQGALTSMPTSTHQPLKRSGGKGSNAWLAVVLLVILVMVIIRLVS
ncbi:MAG: DivIVA domain-containing protein [Arachnia sp.]